MPSFSLVFLVKFVVFSSYNGIDRYKLCFGIMCGIFKYAFVPYMSRCILYETFYGLCSTRLDLSISLIDSFGLAISFNFNILLKNYSDKKVC